MTCRPLAFLLGTWRGEGTGEYPTIEPFAYEEELRFEHVGDTFLLYQQASWSPDDGAPIHFERGFLRPGEPGRIEFTLAHPIGLTEIAEGTLDGTSFELTSTERRQDHHRADDDRRDPSYRVDGDVLRYRTDMATDETPMALHLEAELHRVGAVSDELAGTRDLTYLWLVVSVVGIVAGGILWLAGIARRRRTRRGA